MDNGILPADQHQVNRRNPKNFAPGDSVKVTNPDHRDFTKVGTIIKLEGVANDTSGKPRAFITTTTGALIVVSLGNLSKRLRDD